MVPVPIVTCFSPVQVPVLYYRRFDVGIAVESAKRTKIPQTVPYPGWCSQDMGPWCRGVRPILGENPLIAPSRVGPWIQTTLSTSIRTSHPSHFGLCDAVPLPLSSTTLSPTYRAPLSFTGNQGVSSYVLTHKWPPWESRQFSAMRYL